MSSHPSSDKKYLADNNLHQPLFSVKTESSVSPSLPPASLDLFAFEPQFIPSYPSGRSSATPSTPPVYQFGSDAGSTLNLNAMSNPWPSSSNSSINQPSSAGQMTATDGTDQPYLSSSRSVADLGSTMSFHDDQYDDADDQGEHANDAAEHAFSVVESPHDKNVRRRSTKACDQCRKYKCKCERGANGKICRSCEMLGTACTYDGPSKKRGPPKGYINSIEARLHQLQALLGIMMRCGDERITGFLEDLKRDPLANEIINLVDVSGYGVRGRQKKQAEGTAKKGKARASGSASPVRQAAEPKTKPDVEQYNQFPSTHPTLSWQDRVSEMIQSLSGGDSVRSNTQYSSHPADASDSLLALRYPPSPTMPPHTPVEESSHSSARRRPALRVVPTASVATGLSSPMRRQRRRIDTDSQWRMDTESHLPSPSDIPSALSDSSHSRNSFARPHFRPWSDADNGMEMDEGGSFGDDRSIAMRRGSGGLSSESEEDLPDAMGQLSLNENDQVRFHGKASGLHLLGHKARLDTRNEAGLWRFPEARIWPPLATSISAKAVAYDDEALLPDLATQEHLLELYFAYVHPTLPVVHKTAFWDMYRSRHSSSGSPHSPESEASSTPSARGRARRRIAPILLLAMFSVAARYSDEAGEPPATDRSTMWAAGDEYLDSAKTILHRTYGSSMAATCQALLLMSYREIGIGAMAHAWIYCGAAVRMAQDLGMHRSAEGWARAGLGKLFGEQDLEERNRIWYTCVIMDKYVSAYIGRPVNIFEGDFDARLPSEQDADELELWRQPTSKPHTLDEWEAKPLTEAMHTDPIPGRIISCFNAAAQLSGLLSSVIQSIYAIRPTSRRQSSKMHLERLLDTWYLSLPEHLRHEPGSSRPLILLPNILTLHMQYWCTVLLLHRPFITRKTSRASSISSDGDDQGITRKSYELCAAAANHITSIVSVYMDSYCIRRAPVFLCYYVFSASLMHITTLSTYPTDPQATSGLRKCMQALQRMETAWPSAARAYDLLHGLAVDLEETDMTVLATHRAARAKRSADHSLDFEDVMDRGQSSSHSPDYTAARYAYPEPIPIHSQPALTGAQYMHPFQRWPSESASDPAQYTNPLSTSVLPQIYSTGFSDDRATGHIGSRRGEGDADGLAQGQNGARYPQYWDYPTPLQFGAYSVPEVSHINAPSHNQLTDQFNMHGHYNVYNNHLPNT